MINWIVLLMLGYVAYWKLVTVHQSFFFFFNISFLIKVMHY